MGRGDQCLRLFLATHLLFPGERWAAPGSSPRGLPGSVASLTDSSRRDMRAASSPVFRIDFAASKRTASERALRIKCSRSSAASALASCSLSRPLVLSNALSHRSVQWCRDEWTDFIPHLIVFGFQHPSNVFL